MSSINVNISGLDKLKELVERNKGLRKVVEVSLHRAADRVISYITSHMYSTSTYISSSGITHSVPGGFPAVHTGNLVGSLNKYIHSHEGFEIYSDIPYSIYLENGTEKMAARPFLKPGIINLLPVIETIILKDLMRIYK